jgi:hypothetical protein
MRIAPMMRMLELGVCRDYYRRQEPGLMLVDLSLTSDLCGIDAVQSRLVSVRGVLGTLEVVPGSY